MESEIVALQDRIKALEEKISNYVPEKIYVPVETAATPATPQSNAATAVQKTEPKKVKVINVTGSPFKD